jgi:hypothetical protein
VGAASKSFQLSVRLGCRVAFPTAAQSLRKFAMKSSF